MNTLMMNSLRDRGNDDSKSNKIKGGDGGDHEYKFFGLCWYQVGIHPD